MNTDTPETDRLAKEACDGTGALCRPEILWDALEAMERQRNAALKRLDSSERARKSLSEACDYLQAKQDMTEKMARELRDALDGHDTTATEYSDWQQRAKAAFDKATKLLP